MASKRMTGSLPGQMVRDHHRQIEIMARLGFISRAVTYALIGILAVQVALNQGGKLTDSQGALQTLAGQPFGAVLLGLIALGFAGYALWHLLQACMGRQRQTARGTQELDKGKAGVGHRIMAGAVGIIHLMLAWTAVRILMHAHSGGDPARTWSARLMDAPLGVWAIALAGLIIAGIGLHQVYKAFKEKFVENLELGSLSAKARKAFIQLAKWGISARGLVFCIIGWFLVQAAITHNPAQARGLGGALQTLAGQPFGKILLAIVALGLVLYALYSAFKARYCHVDLPA